jgi:DNA-binding NarL/FixJ family response regulator
MAKVAAMHRRAESAQVSATVITAPPAPVSSTTEPPDSQAAAALAVLGIALDALGVPALLVGSRDEVICSNAAARASPGGVRWPPEAVPANGTTGLEPTWLITPLDGPGVSGWSLVLWHAPEAVLRRRWKLTTRQVEVLELVVRGMTNIAIAETLGIRPGTVEFHISAIFDRVGVNSRAALIANVMGR